MALNKILGMFVDIEDATPAQSADAPAEEPVTVTPKPDAPQSNGDKIFVDREIADALEKALAEANQPGFDFHEFMVSLTGLQDVIPDERTRYRAAFSTASSMNIEVDDLIQSAQHYLDVLEKEKDAFGSAIASSEQESVVAVEAEIEDIDAQMRSRVETIERLTDELADLREQKLEKQNLASNSRSKIEAKRQVFDVTLEAVRDRIEQNIDNINQYLRTPATNTEAETNG